MRRVIILLGPTAVGKTGASILLAKKLGTEIISADSMQIYRGMDIGTSKPSFEERSGVVHHMIDIAGTSESFSAGQFVERISPIINDLHRREKIPIIVGGTGLYIKAITRGIFSGPSADWDLREDLLIQEQDSPGALYRHLSLADPETAARTEPNDIRRIVRALEVCISSGKKMSHLQEYQTKPLPYEFVKIGLTRQREELYRMIDERVDAMITAGLVDEVHRLLGLNPGQTPMQAIGYKEIALYLNNELPLDEAVRLIKRNSRRYAKRQFTWFRKEKEISWIDVTGILSSRIILDKILGVLEANRAPQVAER